MMKKMFTAAMLSLALVGILFPASGTAAAEPSANAAGSSGFKDSIPEWAASDIQGALKQGYVKGYPDGTFKPDNNVTRAEYIKMVVDALGLEKGTVKSGAPWFEPYVDAAIAANIHREKDFVDGNLNKPMTRLEMSRIAVRAIKPEFKDPSALMDDKSFMYNATKRGIIRGMSNGELAVDGLTTRAQSVVVIQRILSILAGETLPFDKVATSYAEVALRGTNFETMWGARTKKLPLELRTNLPDFKVTIDQILVTDMTDKNSPYYNNFPELRTIGVLTDGTKLDNKYLIAMHVNLENTKAKEKALWPFDWKFENEMDYARVYLHSIKKESLKVSFKESPAIRLETVGKTDGWYFLAIDKKLADSDPKTKIIPLYNMMFQNVEYVTAEEW
ncbi:S-layer homology domain-containing protein [Paenibacillus sp.]|uniref:S-layer homology domain-containing protein n=1 Tax=Paenibacillus sp. TaxID=58172 RepID=UPI0028112538|nr:S-layer homology domain-containing protein [Paenibacillus sp.]